MGHVSLQVFHQSKSQACASTDAAEDLKSVCLLDGIFVEKKKKRDVGIKTNSPRIICASSLELTSRLTMAAGSLWAGMALMLRARVAMMGVMEKRMVREVCMNGGIRADCCDG